MSGIEAVAATFHFRRVSRKRVFLKKNCWVQLPDCWELQEEKRKSLGVLWKTGSVGSSIKEPQEVWMVLLMSPSPI